MVIPTEICFDMKILYLHNEYRSSVPSGENQVVLKDFQMLRDSGVDIDYINLTSDKLLGKLKIFQFFQVSKALISFRPPKIVNKYISENKPEIVHIHNTFPLLGFAFFKYLHKRGIRLVMTIHNSRISCLTSTHFRDGKVCNKCSIQLGYKSGIYYRCYQKSRILSAYLGLYNRWFIRSFRYIDHFVVLNDYSRELLTSQGIPSNLISKRVPVESAGNLNVVKKKHVIFAGRLTEEKGIDLLLKAWEISNMGQLGWNLIIAGAGNLEHLVHKVVSSDTNVNFLGFLDQKELIEAVSESSILCVPSKGFEGFPTIISQAAEHGISVITTNIGPLAELSSSWISCVNAEPRSLAAEFDRQAEIDFLSKFESSKIWFQTMKNNDFSGKTLLAIYSKIRTN